MARAEAKLLARKRSIESGKGNQLINRDQIAARARPDILYAFRLAGVDKAGSAGSKVP